MKFPKVKRPDRRPEFLDAVRAAGQMMIDRAEDIIPQDLYSVSDLDIRVRIDDFCGAVMPALEVQAHRFPLLIRPEPVAKEDKT